MFSRIGYVATQTFRFLTFRKLNIKNNADLNSLMVAGVFFAWIAGLGRYWDHPSAHQWQYWGLGSVAYIFVLSLLIWLIVLPLRPKIWNYRSVLTFVGLTSPLAWLYAIPVERFVSMDLAIKTNVWFLAIVAAWRVALYVQFLRTVGKLPGGVIFVVTLLPLTIIVFALAMLNLEHAVFEIMAGLEQERRGQELIHDNVYGFIFLLGALSMLFAPIFFLIYCGICIVYFKERASEKKMD